MNKNGVLQFIKSAAWIMTFVFTLGVVLTGIILVGRLGEFVTTEKSRTVVQLNQESSKQTPQSPTDSTNKKPSQNSSANTPIKPGFEASDAQGVWEQSQQVEIFKVRYDEKGNISVDGVGDKVIAPGTSNIYNFTFKNTGNIGLRYTLTTEVEFSDAEHALPVTVRMYDQNKKYIIGSAAAFDDPQKLNIVSETAELSPKSYANYAFEWQWPFESGNDEYDTLLGNLAVGEDLTMTVKINVRAEADADASGGNPYTGDNSSLTLYIILFGISVLGIVAMLIVSRRKQKEGLAEDE